MSDKTYNPQVENWIRHIQNSRGIDAEQTINNCSLLEQYALQSDDDELLGYAYYFLGETYYGLNEIEKLFMYMTKAIGYLETTSQWELSARAYNLLGITSMNRGNAPFAMEYYLNGLTYSSKYEYYDLMIILNSNIASLYMSVNEYAEATRYLEQAYQIIHAHQELPDYYPFLCALEVGLAKCYMKREIYEVAWRHLHNASNECLPKLGMTDFMYVKAFEARLYHVQGDIANRNASIESVIESMEATFTLLDYFDEFYEFSEMLLEIKLEDEFWKVMDILEELATYAKVVNLQRKLLALKIKYYKEEGDASGYLQAAGLFYELSEVIEKENQYMVSTMLRLRNNLNRETQMRRQAERENEVLHLQSETDALTGLGNRFRLNMAAEEKFNKAIESRRALAIEIVDIDFFKIFNDQYGHQVGDDCLVAVADNIKLLQKHEGVTGFRYGGDEFIIIYEGYNMESVKAMATELAENLLTMNLVGLKGEQVRKITLSQGICWGMPGSDDKVFDYLHAADDQLYEVKKNNRNGVSIGRFEKR